MLPSNVISSWEIALNDLDAHIKTTVVNEVINATSPLIINECTLLQFEDGTTMDGATLLKSLKTLQYIIDKDYPEVLL